MRRLNALALAAALVGWSLIGPRLRPGWRSTVQAGMGALLVAATRAPLGLRPPELRAGARLGLVAGAVATATIAATTTVPVVRAAMAVREPPASVPLWLWLRIPLGTVWAEEAAFRSALGTAGAAAFGKRSGRLLQASAFGLSHIADARAAGDPVAVTVLVTGVAGWFFGWLAERSGSLAAPMLAHLAINEAGAIAALTVRP
jgi:uncharacterized protein